MRVFQVIPDREAEFATQVCILRMFLFVEQAHSPSDSFLCFDTLLIGT